MNNHIRKLNRPLASFVHVSSDTLQNLIAQLIELSSRGDIRVTDDGRYSIYDVIGKIAEKCDAPKVWKRLTDKDSAVLTNCHVWQFPGERQRQTPVTDLAGIIEIIWLLPGDFSNKFRKLGAQLVSEAITSQDESKPTDDLLNAVQTLTNVVSSQYQTINNLTRKLNKLADGFEIVTTVNSEYLNLRRYADTTLPGLIELADKIIDSQFSLPAATVHFTAPEWVERHAPELSQRQRICFYKEIAAAHRFLVGCMPQKIKGKYWYTNKHQILFERAYTIASTMIPVETKQLKPESCPIFPLAERFLNDFERSLLGQEMKVTQLATKLNLNLSVQNQSRLGVEVKKMVKTGIIARPKIAGSSSRIFQVTPELITVVKEFAHGTC